MEEEAASEDVVSSGFAKQVRTLPCVPKTCECERR